MEFVLGVSGATDQAMPLPSIPSLDDVSSCALQSPTQVVATKHRCCNDKPPQALTPYLACSYFVATQRQAG
jgi:hypothetical protein